MPVCGRIVLVIYMAATERGQWYLLLQEENAPPASSCS